MDATAHTVPAGRTATLLLALATAFCLLAWPGTALAEGFSLGSMFGALVAQDEASQPEEAEALDEADNLGFVVGLPSLTQPDAAAGETVDDSAEATPVAEDEGPAPEAAVALDPAWPEAERPSFAEAYTALTGEELPTDTDDPVTAAALNAVGYEAAGVVVWIPAGFDVIALDEVMVAAIEDEFYVDVTQFDADFEGMGGAQDLALYLQELADEDPSVSLMFSCDENGVAQPSVTELGVEYYGLVYYEEGDASEYICLYIPTLDGGLANMWLDVPVEGEDAHYYAELAEFMAMSIMLVDPATDPVDIAAVAAAGEPAATEIVESDGVTFAVPGMEYDDEFEGWVRYDDCFAFVTTYADYFYGDEVAVADLEDAAAELAEQDGMYAAGAYLEHGDTGVYVYVGLSDDGYMEVYGFVPMADGTVTLVAGLCDAYDTLSTEVMAVVFQSIGYAAGSAGDVESLLEEGDASGAFAEEDLAPHIDPSYLEKNAKLV